MSAQGDDASSIAPLASVSPAIGLCPSCVILLSVDPVTTASTIKCEYYYKHNLVVAVHQGEYILLNLRIPIQSLTATMSLFHVKLFLVPHNNQNDSGFTVITGVNDYFAVSRHGHFYASLTQLDAESCSRSHCERPFPISPRTYRTCASVLFYGDTWAIDKYCSINYSLDRRHMPLIVPMGGSDLLVTSDDGWLLKCQGKMPVDVLPCALCVIKGPCHCIGVV